MTQQHEQLAKTETAALWHAVEWMNKVLREWRRCGFRDAGDKARWEAERLTLREALRALRKVNAIRQAQAEVAKLRNFANCRPAGKLQAKQKTAGGAA